MSENSELVVDMVVKTAAMCAGISESVTFHESFQWISHNVVSLKLKRSKAMCCTIFVHSTVLVRGPQGRVYASVGGKAAVHDVTFAGFCCCCRRLCSCELGRYKDFL